MVIENGYILTVRFTEQQPEQQARASVQGAFVQGDNRSQSEA
jgi:hypothetical protein